MKKDALLSGMRWAMQPCLYLFRILCCTMIHIQKFDVFSQNIWHKLDCRLPKSLSFESSRVKSFCIINSLSHLPFFLSLFSSSFSSGEDWSAHKVVRVNLTLICRLMKVFGFIAMYVGVAILYDSIFLPWVNLWLVSDFTRTILQQKASHCSKSFYEGTQEAGIIFMLFPLYRFQWEIITYL